MPPSVEDTGLIWSAMLGYPHAFRKQATEEAPGAETRFHRRVRGQTSV